MENYTIIEKKFFTYLQKQFSKNDLIRLNESYVPNHLPNGVNRFYSSNNSIWFSRLNVTDNKKIYYFGIMEDIIPEAIIACNKDFSKSTIRFTKNEKVYLRVKISSSLLNQVKNLFNLKYATKDKSSDFYFLELGTINTSDLIKNIETLIQNFKFKVSLNNKALTFDRYVEHTKKTEENEEKPEINYNNTLKLNMEIITIKNAILNKKISYSTTEKLKDYLFSQVDGDFILNSDFKNNFELNDDELLLEIKNSIEEIDSSFNYESIIEKINQNIEENKLDTASIEKYESDDSLSELEQMDIVLKAISEDKQISDAAEIAEISEDKIYEWYEEGEEKTSQNTIYFYDKLNEILFITNKISVEKPDYKLQITELNSNFNSKEKNIREMIERCFPAPQITNVKFNKDVDLCSKIFSQKMENIMKILEVTDEYSPKIEEEIRLNINILNDICSKIDSLNDELVISLSKDGDDDAEAILEEMERLIDSVKDY